MRLPFVAITAAALALAVALSFRSISSVSAFGTVVRIRPLSQSRMQSSSSRVQMTSDAPSTETKSASSSPSEEEEEDEKAFLARTAALCSLRNLPLTGVKNARDLSTVTSSPVRPNRVYRCGRVSDASPQDISLLFDQLGIKTLVDLRSPTELKDDPTLEREEVFGDFVSVVWRENRLTGNRDKDRSCGSVKVLEKGERRIRTRVNEDGTPKKGRRSVSEILGGLAGGDDDDVEEDEEDELNAKRGKVSPACCEPLPSTSSAASEEGGQRQRKERHFVSIMNELKYVRGTLSKLRKRDVAKALLISPPAVVSRRARHKVKDVFLSEINGGGLPMLNELLLKYGAPGIRYVLEVCSDPNRHPVAFYCTAGKDRTGVIAAVLLSALGVPDESIVEDYSLSANVYAEMDDHTAMVGALSQRNLDPKTFLGAPPRVMRDTLVAIRENYGSVEGYLDWIGFDEKSRMRLREALLSEDGEEGGDGEKMEAR